MFYFSEEGVMLFNYTKEGNIMFHFSEEGVMLFNFIKEGKIMFHFSKEGLIVFYISLRKQYLNIALF